MARDTRLAGKATVGGDPVALPKGPGYRSRYRRAQLASAGLIKCSRCSYHGARSENSGGKARKHTSWKWARGSQFR